MRTFKDKQAHREWRRRFKNEMRGWRSGFHREMRANTAEWGQNWNRYWSERPCHGFGFGMTLTFLEVFGVVATTLCIYAIWSLLAHGTVFGVQLSSGVPTWLWVIILILVCKILTTPGKVMRWTARHGGGYCGVAGGMCVAFWNTFFAVALTIFLFWLFRHHGPEARDALHNAASTAHRASDSIREGWNNR